MPNLCIFTPEEDLFMASLIDDLELRGIQTGNSAHACSEIGLKWFLFALHDLRKVFGFVSGLDFFE
jgi:hypothetical protein